MNECILVVDDDPKLNQAACTYLNDCGYEAKGCLSAEAAYDAMYSQLFDLIISDIMMPGTDGFEFAETIRGLNKTIPILFMSARDDLPAKQKGFDLGIDDYMVKPIDFSELRMRVRALLRRANIEASRKLTVGGLVLDGTTPIVDSFLSRGIRISAMIPPIADRDAGASFSIRRQRIKELSAQDFIDTKMASKDMLDFLSFALNHGASIAICGNTRGGKTSLISYLLSTVHPDRRIYCIEETKEIEVVRYGEDGRVANSVVHTTTRESESPQANVDMNDLLRHALRFDPDIIAPVEIRGPEALTVQEAGRTGHTIITSLHANSCRAAYNRILSMCEMADTMLPSHVLTQMIVEAFPIVVHLRRCPDNQQNKESCNNNTRQAEFIYHLF